MRVIWRVLIVVAVVVWAAPVYAATYYVATTGSDSNPGTEAQPYASIQKAADVVNPGDTVIVKDGTYVDTYFDDSYSIVHVNRGGTAGNYITFKAEHPLGAKLNGQSNTTKEGWFLEADYIRIEGFEIYGVSHTGIVGYASHVQVVGNSFHDIGRYCNNGPYGEAGIFTENVSDWTVERNIFHDIGRYDAAEGGCTPTTNLWLDHGLYIDQTDTLVVKNNIFYNINRGWPVHIEKSTVGSSNVNILNNTFSGVHPNAYLGGHILLSSPAVTNAVIENNISYAPKNGNQIAYYDVTLSNVVARNNMTYPGTISSPSPPAGISFSGNLDNTNPLFVNPAAYNFQLQLSSPAKDAGLTQASVTTDYAGVVRPQGSAYDIGAYEYVVTAPTNDLAQGKTTTVSSTESGSYPGSNAVDGSYSTRWSSAFSDPQWIYVDLVSSYVISEVRLYWEAAYGSTFKIQTSANASDWTDVYSTSSGTGGTQILAVTPSTGRYVRMYGTARGTSYGYSLYAFEVHGSPPTASRAMSGMRIPTGVRIP